MCNYCGCRAIEPIAQLTTEHEVILKLVHEIRAALARGARGTAAERLSRLQEVLEIHDAVEELAVYPAMARHPEFADRVGTLFDEHDDLDQVIRGALAAGPGRSGAPTWTDVSSALETLVEHIDHEEHGLFPAAAVCLDPADWDRATAVRRGHRSDGQPVDPGRSLARRPLSAPQLERTV